MLFTNINPLWAGNSKRELAQSNDVRVTDVKIIRGELVGGWFQAIEEVDELTVGDIFVIEVEVTNYGSETVHVLNLYDWDLSPQNRVGIIGTPSYCLGPIELQPSESATLYPFCLSQAFEAEGEGWVTISIYVDDWNFNRLCEDAFSFRVVVEEKPRVKFKGTAECDEYEVYDEYGNYVIGAWVDEILEDPQGKLAVGDFVHITYQESHGFKQGDCIEAYGTYVEEEWGPVIVVGGAYGSPGDYIKKCDTIPPSITNIRESNDPINKQGCPEPTTVTIRADVTDASGLAWVRLYYRPPGGSWTYRAMSRESGNTYKATIGPFGQAGTLEYYVKARDNAGNETQSSTRTIIVHACGETRGLYVDGFENILGDAELEDKLLSTANSYSIDYLALYGLHLVDMGPRLANFIAKAKNEYGIKEIGAVGGVNTDFFDDIAEFNQLYTYHFDVLNLEFEYWNKEKYPDRPFDEFMSILEHMRTIANNQGLKTEVYLGWPNQSEAQQIGPLVDRVLLHAYVDKPEQAYNYSRERLQLFASNQRLIEIWPIFSLEDEFMGPWMENHSFADAESIYLEDYRNEHEDWITYISIGGFQWFKYSLIDHEVFSVYLPSILKNYFFRLSATSHSEWQCQGKR